MFIDFFFFINRIIYFLLIHDERKMIFVTFNETIK